jgi:CRP/FNR family transcriptional regulator, dissimilatory nitrate respiration regulator
MQSEATPMTTRLSELRTLVIINTLRSCQLFTGLPAADLRNIAAVAAIKTLAKDSYLFHERDAAQGFYVVQSGAISVGRVNAAGKEQIIHVFRAGESFAEVALASSQGYPADARAQEASQVLLVEKQGILTLLKRQPELALRMLGSMSSHLRVLVGQLDDLTLKDFETRLANWLLKRCPPPFGNRPVSIQLKMTKRLLAAELGTISETFSRTLAKFRQQNLILVKGNQITILAPTRLNDLLRQHLGER